MTTMHHSFLSKDHNLQKDELDKILELVEENDHSKQEIVKTEEQKLDFFIPRCSTCERQIQFSEGDVIYGDKWYHNSCWKGPEKIELASH